MRVLPVIALLWTAQVLCAATTNAAVDAYADADRHYAGSQIAIHEGHGEPVMRDDGRPLGNDVSRWQGDVDWADVAAKGGKFSYIKATEGTGYQNPHFTQQYNGSYEAGLIRGAYHFARPDAASGAEQAEFFVANGGGWSPDGKTLPGALDVEYNPYGDDPCYELTPEEMTAWIRDFSQTYNELAGRPPAIYTSTSWWKRCTGNADEFGMDNPLWLARYNDSVGELPAGWPTHTIWQFADKGTFPGDQNEFNGGLDQLRRVAAQ